MDHYRLFSPEDIPYYQRWIRKVAGNKNIWVKMYDKKWLSKLPQSWQSKVNWSSACVTFSNSRTIRINFNLAYKLTHKLRYHSCDVKALLLHEAGHVMTRITGGMDGWDREYLAEMWAMRKASRLGLEKEKSGLVWQHRFWCEIRGECASDYSTAYHMLKMAGIDMRG